MYLPYVLLIMRGCIAAVDGEACAPAGSVVAALAVAVLVAVVSVASVRAKEG